MSDVIETQANVDGHTVKSKMVFMEMSDENIRYALEYAKENSKGLQPNQQILISFNNDKVTVSMAEIVA